MKKSGISLDAIARALENDNFVFYYQAKVSMHTGQISGVEALIRWLTPDGTIIPPDAFIPIAEQRGYITKITRHMFTKLVTDIRLIHDVNDSIGVAFNASTQDFETSDLSDAVCMAVKEQLEGSSAVEIEVTEASLLSESNTVRKNLCALAERGVSLTMDDFGAGFSTIDILGKFPFSTIKVDKQIVQRIQNSEKDLAIVQSSIRMAHKIGVDIVAEGVEDRSTYNFLLNAGCTHAQGYLISRPVPLLEFLELLKSQPRWPALPIGLLHMAELDHIEWRKALMDAVFSLGFSTSGFSSSQESMASGFSKFPNLDYTACRLGRWYYGAGQQYAGIAEFDMLEGPHKRLHNTGRELLKAVQNGTSEKKIMTLMRKLSEDSALIIGLLQKLQNEAVVVTGWAQMDASNASFDHVHTGVELRA